ncbi:MAG TPA: glycosyltransferase [Holophaga sp.]|nr:glycosyltransferase [Holophaga sp.]
MTQDGTASKKGRERREQKRYAINVSGKIFHRPALRSSDNMMRVTDISRSGAKIETMRPLAPGDWVTLRIPQFKAVQRRPNSYIKVRAKVLHEAYASDGELGGFTYGVQFARDSKGLFRFAMSRILPWAATMAIIAIAILVGFFKTENIKFFWYHPFFNTYGILVSAYILSRFILAVFYRPPEHTPGYEPTVTAMVVCKNEEKAIYKTIQGIFQANYPLEKMQVISVNDGSTDGTLAEMERAKADHPSLEVIHFEINRGKRHGMAAGARKAKGDILVYVDSDSFIQPDAIRELVTAFADPEIGGVCGHANVDNARTNLLTKMQEVRYFVAFRVVKAAESVFSAVTCCSGCLAAYRRTYLLEFLDEWLAQTFLGCEATFGDDRSLTNKMLRNWKVIYNSRATCTTIVPEDWKVFFRQQLRWKKSWIRESLLATKFMWKRHPLVGFFFYFGVIFPLLSPVVVANALIIPVLHGQWFSLQYVLGTTVMATLFGLVYFARYRTRIWVYGIWFSFFYMFVLVWQTYYALLTVRKNHWGTR